MQNGRMLCSRRSMSAQKHMLTTCRYWNRITISLPARAHPKTLKPLEQCIEINNRSGTSQMASVLLGLCDSQKPIGREATSWEINKIGGAPDWMNGCSVPVCSLCGQTSTFVCQIYSPLEGSQYHRVLYLFACSNKLCWNKSDSWSVLRSQSKTVRKENVTEQLVKTNSASGDFGFETFDWDDDFNTESCGDRKPVADEILQLDIGADNNIASSSVHSISDCKSESGLLPEIESIASLAISDKQLAQTKEINDDDNAEHADDFSAGSLQESNNSLECEMDASGPLDENKSAIMNEQLQLAMSSFLREVVHTEASDCSSANAEQNSAQEVVVFTSYYIDVVNEDDYFAEETENFYHAEELLHDYMKKENITLKDLDEAMHCDGGKQSGKHKNRPKQTMENCEEYELADITDEYNNFVERTRGCPQQIIRYSYRGKELFLQPPKYRHPLKCSCGAKRVFELQLMPGMLNYLKVKEHQDPVLDFGCVLVYTCIASCWNDEFDQYKNEHVVVQEDESLTVGRTQHSRCKSNFGKYKLSKK